MSVGHASSVVTPAILLASVPYGEADRVVTLYTRSHGKVSAMARAARKSRARFGASLSLFVVGEATLRERRGAEMMSLERFDAVRDFSTVGADVVAMAHASYATELTNRLTAPRQVDPALFDLLVELYEVVCSVPPASDTLRAFELRLLGEVGLRPVLDRCVSCGSDADAVLDEAGAVLDPGQGGLVCGRCAGQARGEGIRPLPARARHRLLQLQEASIAGAAAGTPLDAEAGARAREAIHAILAAHLRSPLKSLEFLHKLRSA